MRRGRWRAGAGFEPATLSLGSGFTEGPGARSDSQGVGNTRGEEDAGVQPSQPEQFLLGDSATPLLRDERAGASDAGPLLTVRDVARRLGVSTATVYKLCASGQLPHVRVLNVLRVATSAVRAFVNESTRGPATPAPGRRS